MRLTIFIGAGLWSEQYEIRADLKPDFITQELAETILWAGKSLVFLR